MSAPAQQSRKYPGWLLLLAVIGVVVYRMSVAGTPRVPVRFARGLPDSCRQVLLVLADGEISTTGKLWLLERKDAVVSWKAAWGPVPVVLGRNGLAWGAGEHTASAPAGFRIKKEGDGCSPAGIFRIPYAFGNASAAPGLRLKYLPITSTLAGVDDPKSRHYNEVVDSDSVERDWAGSETMSEIGSYRWGAFVAHNPAKVPGAGSCIFLHVWSGPGQPTAGCTAMREEDLIRVLNWIDPAREPRLVQGLASW